MSHSQSMGRSASVGLARQASMRRRTEEAAGNGGASFSGPRHRCLFSPNETAIRIARQVNKRIGRQGPVFAHRYHSRELSSPMAVKRALHYVIGNRRKHALAEGDRVPNGFIDPCSSANHVLNWSRRPKGMPPPPAPPGDDAPVASPKTWLLAKAWHQEHGGLDAFESVAG